jgi:hypothetical protein
MSDKVLKKKIYKQQKREQKGNKQIEPVHQHRDLGREAQT